jgi:hypothetical protein
MKREFCKVEEITGENIVIRNVRNEIYHVGKEKDRNFELGDRIVIAYEERHDTGKGYFIVDECRLLKDNNKILQPYLN